MYGVHFWYYDDKEYIKLYMEQKQELREYLLTQGKEGKQPLPKR